MGQAAGPVDVLACPFIASDGGRWRTRFPTSAISLVDDVFEPGCPRLTLVVNNTELLRVPNNHIGNWENAFAITRDTVEIGMIDGRPPSEYRIEVVRTVNPPDPELGFETALRRPFKSEDGFAWSTALPAQLEAIRGNRLGANSHSRILVCENGQPLARRHVDLANIIAEGRGAHVHWHNTIFFSTSDNTDPNVNGRNYTAKVVQSSPRAVGFGSCHIGLMMRRAAERGWCDIVTHDALVHNSMEILQLIENIRRKTYIPAQLEPYTGHGRVLAGSGCLESCEIKFIEICNSSEVIYRDWRLNRAQIYTQIVRPCQAMSPEMGRAARSWFEIGVTKQNEATRQEASAYLLENLPSLTPDDQLRRDVIRLTYGREETERESFDRVEQIINAVKTTHTVIAAHTLRYLPDGRPLRWPAGFHERVQKIASAFGLPFLDAAALVEELGAEASLTPDLEHHTPQFLEAFAKRAFGLVAAPC